MKSMRLLALVVLGTSLTARPAFAQVTEYWNPSGSSSGATDGGGTWNSTASTWYNPGSGSNPVVWDNVSTDTAVFGSPSSTSGGNIVITGTVNVSEIDLDSGNGVGYSFDDGGNGGTVVGNSGTLTIANNSTGFYSGSYYFNGLNFDASTFNFDSANGQGIKIINSTLNNNNPVTFNLGNGSDSGLVVVAGGGFGRGDITLKVANGWTFQDGNGNSLASATVVGFGGNKEAGNGDYEYGALAITAGKGTTTPVTTIPTITLTGDTLIANGDGNSGGGSSILQGTIGGTGNLYLAGGEFRDYESATGQTKANVASLIVATTNSSYTGATIISENTMNEGYSEEGPGLGYQTVALGANNALSTTGELVLGVKSGTAPISGATAQAYTSNGVFDMAGYSQTVSGLATGNGVTASANYIGNNSGAGTSTLTVAGTSTPTTGFGGTIQDNLGTTGGTVAVALTSGVLTLTGTNTYSGGTSVTGGTFYVNNTSGSGTGVGNVAVTGGKLAGSGTITPSAGNTISVGPGATLSSGAAQTSDATHETVTGKGLTFVNSAITSGTFLSVAAGSTLQFSLGAGAASDPGSTLNYETPNTNSTYLTVTGNQAGEINFGLGSSITISLIDLTALDSTSPNTLALRYNQGMLLIDAGLDSDYANLVTTGGVDQNGYVLGVGTSNASPSDYTPFTITMTNINGGTVTTYNDLGLYLYNGQLEIVPEPSTWALMIGGLGLLLFLQRRRRARSPVNQG